MSFVSFSTISLSHWKLATLTGFQTDLMDVQMIRFYQLCYAPHARQQCEVHIHGHNLLQSNLPSCSMGMKIVEYLENAPCGAKKSIRDKKEENTQVFDGFLTKRGLAMFQTCGLFPVSKNLSRFPNLSAQWVGTHCPPKPVAKSEPRLAPSASGASSSSSCHRICSSPRFTFGQFQLGENQVWIL